MCLFTFCGLNFRVLWNHKLWIDINSNTLLPIYHSSLKNNLYSIINYIFNFHFNSYFRKIYYIVCCNSQCIIDQSRHYICMVILILYGITTIITFHFYRRYFQEIMHLSLEFSSAQSSLKLWIHIINLFHRIANCYSNDCYKYTDWVAPAQFIAPHFWQQCKLGIVPRAPN